MKKNIKLIIFSAAIVLLLVAALIVVLNIPENDYSGENDTVSSDILLYDKTQLDPEEITVKNNSGKYVLIGYNYIDQASRLGYSSLYEESSETESNSSSDSSNKRVNRYNEEVVISMLYTMQGYEDMQLSKDMTDQLAYQCSYAAATMLIDKSKKKYADYGLDKPVATVTTVFSDNSKETLYIGETAPDEQGIYVRWSGNDNVYLMPVESVNMFLIKKLQMFDKTITKDFDDDNNENSISDLTISGTGYKQAIKISVGTNAMTTSKYVMNSPYREICGAIMVESVGESIFGITGDEIVAAQITDKDKKEFGLDKPYMKITAKSSDNSSVTILASKADDDGNCYIMANSGNIICKTSVEDIESWYDVKYTDFLAMAYIMPDMNKVNSFNISYNGNETNFKLEHKAEVNDLFEEVITTTATLNGKKINYSNLTTFIYNLSNITRKEMDIKNLDGFEEIASFTFSYQGNKEITDKLVIYKNEKSRYAVTLNDTIEGTTDGEYAEKVFEQIDQIALEDTLKKLGDSEESEEETSEEISDE